MDTRPLDDACDSDSWLSVQRLRVRGTFLGVIDDSLASPRSARSDPLSEDWSSDVHRGSDDHRRYLAHLVNGAEELAGQALLRANAATVSGTSGSSLARELRQWRRTRGEIGCADTRSEPDDTDWEAGTSSTQVLTSSAATLGGASGTHLAAELRRWHVGRSGCSAGLRTEILPQESLSLDSLFPGEAESQPEELAEAPTYGDPDEAANTEAVVDPMPAPGLLLDPIPEDQEDRPLGQQVPAEGRHRHNLGAVGEGLAHVTRSAPSQASSCQNPGSWGHPEVCRRPCAYFAAGGISGCKSGVSCTFCHLPHRKNAQRLDKHHREELAKLSLSTRLAVEMPILTEKAESIGLELGLLHPLQKLVPSKAPAGVSRKFIMALKAMPLRALLQGLAKDCSMEATQEGLLIAAAATGIIDFCDAWPLSAADLGGLPNPAMKGLVPFHAPTAGTSQFSCAENNRVPRAHL